MKFLLDLKINTKISLFQEVQILLQELNHQEI